MTRTINRFVTKMRGPVDPSLERHQEIYREWERTLATASSPSERAEIDAIFSRHLV